MKNQRKHLRHVILHCFTKDNNAKDTTIEICTVYESDATSVQTVRSCFTRLGTDNFYLEDEEGSSHLSITDTELIKNMVNKNPRYIVRELADILNIPQTTVHDNFTRIDYINRSENNIFLANPGSSGKIALYYFHRDGEK
ncbi:Histone-lysine N-methyltransferase SETMAR [Vespula squamosa]|uniref:Histone-lysine N-methyltransferase SETMAR n=1 Tax=Vespula squamosa TaxID=30214 RepID=A0ABD2BSJ8_VESSQ